MTYPSSDVSTTDMDAGTDSPAAARSDLLDLATKFNLLRNHVSTFMQGLFTAADQAAARAALGVGALAAFSAYRSSNQTLGPVAIFDTIETQVGSGYSNSTGIFAAPISGWYSFSASGELKNTGMAGANLIFSFLVNGLPKGFQAPFVVSGDSATVCLSISCYLTASDQVKVNLPQLGTVVSLYATGTSTRFSGVYMGA